MYSEGWAPTPLHGTCLSLSPEPSGHCWRASSLGTHNSPVFINRESRRHQSAPESLIEMRTRCRHIAAATALWIACAAFAEKDAGTLDDGTAALWAVQFRGASDANVA